ncbi:MAG: hypothetical protein MR015_07685 [Clostridiales bacterium]|nr:hypothetical protein [Clostridiales bacterium]
MKYYKLIYDFENSDEWINCIQYNSDHLDEYFILEGEKQENWKNPYFDYDSKDGRILSDFVGNIYGWPIVSLAGANLLKSIVTNTSIQLLPIMLRDKQNKGQEVECFIINILNLAEDAFDYDHSQYTFFELDDEKILSVTHYSLISNRISDFDIFRISENPVAVFVSELVKNKIEQTELTGFDFVEVKTY